MKIDHYKTYFLVVLLGHSVLLSTLASEKESWLQQLKVAEYNTQGPEDYFINHPPPSGLVVIHAWDPSPFIDKDRSIGHMSLQIGDYYLSVWPSKSNADNTSSACNHDLHTDFSEMGSSNFLILDISKPEEYVDLESRVERYLNTIEDGAHLFSVGTSELVLEGEDFSCTWSAGGRFSHIGIEALVKRLACNHVGYVTARRGFCAMLGLGLTATGPGALLGLPYLAASMCPILLGRENVNLRLHHINPDISCGETLNCTQAVLKSLEVIPNLKHITETCYRKESYKTNLPFMLEMPLVVHYKKESPHTFAHEQDTEEEIRIKLKLNKLESRTSHRKDNMALCIIDTQANTHDNFAQFLHKVQELLTSNIGRLRENFDKLKKRFKINKGRTNILFVDPMLFPGGTLRRLALHTYQAQREGYYYSSFERSFDRPVGHRVKFKTNKNGGTLYLGLQIIHHRVYEPLSIRLSTKDYQKDDISNEAFQMANIFRLVPSGEDQTYFILTELHKKALGVDDQGGLVVSQPHFTMKQRFSFSPSVDKGSAEQEPSIRIISQHTHESLTGQGGTEANVCFSNGENSIPSEWIIETVE